MRARSSEVQEPEASGRRTGSATAARAAAWCPFFFVRRELAPVASVRSCRALCGAFPRADTSAPGISRGPGLRLDFWVGVLAEILLLPGDFLKLQDFHF